MSMRSPRRNATDDPQLQRATHLVILQHGLLGSKHDFARFVEIFRSQFQSDELYLHSGESNATSFFQTYDGVDLGGERLADEIQQLAAKMPKLQKLSMVGHSLGGLYNRYCIALLLSRGFFDKIEPMNFVTLATPHLGIRRPRRGATNVVFNALMPKIFSRTGAQLTLTDEANEETQKLSKTSIAYLNKDFHPATFDVKGSLLISLPVSSKHHDNDQGAFELYDCNLSDRKLRVFGNKESTLKLEVDLSCADVKILLPSGKRIGDGANFYSSFIGWGESGEDQEKPDIFGNFDIHIRWLSDSPTGKASEANLCVLRIPEEDIHQDWRWLVALSNSSFGVRCVTSSDGVKETKPRESTTPPLLSCLTRGLFMQALQLFKVRTLYSSIFFDMQVPYTCAAVRAYNPYRLSAKELVMSPIYTHIVLDSLKGVRKLRDTIPLKVKRLAMKYMMPHHAALASPSNEEEQLQNVQDVENSGVSSVSSSKSTRRHASDPGRTSGSTFTDSGRHRHLFSRHRGKTVGSLPSQRHGGSRPEPFVEGDVILDQLPYAFTADAEQDELRGMLLSVQSVGWRRIDVMFGGIMSHEHIIAKRARLDKPLESGVDVVHHVMDTFVV
ncbi:putative lipase [Phytophthora citrophthora]|uniref:Lipase n=1 Tax=Phytophthora citrophthora TaxID=4793 RepID=A0AAD9FZG4_9STRA|nr:putative lipase [Phytophthora citrophthora]